MTASFASLLRRRELGSSCTDASCSLGSLLEGDTLQSCHTLSLQLQPTPRSCIALAFSSDGLVLASSQCAPIQLVCIQHVHALSALLVCSGDHTVKLSSVQSGACLQTLHGHRRTPWVVRMRKLAQFTLLRSKTSLLGSGQMAPTPQ